MALLVGVDDDGDEDGRETYDIDDLVSAKLSGVTATDGGFLLTGEAREEGSSTPVGYAVAIDGDGDHVWTETYDDGRFWRSTAAGDRSVIAGRTDAFREGDAWLLAIDAEGQEVWSETYDTDGPASLNDVVGLGDGGLLGGGDGGYLAVGSLLDDTEANDRIGLVLRVDEDGELEDDAEWDDDGTSSITSVVEAGGTRVVAGYVDDDDGSDSDEDRPEGRLVRGSF